ncbi:MAG TPA: glycosyltransferase family 4 protein, partial [Gaiellaceae bacterium]|nr:glycosyltransferase family 4 protein [Gaiellaceae bacterium]
MRIHIWHGYLLGGTGSNVYTRQLVREWSLGGHDVTVFSQEPEPGRYDIGTAKAVRPDVGGLLPTFVIDVYPGYEVKRLQECTRAELDAWVEANASALREHGSADLTYVNHVLLGGAVGAASGGPYIVKAHGSELEYSMRGNTELSAWGGESLTAAAATIVGSAHIREVVHEVCGTVDGVHEVPPGVDVELWKPAPREEALERLIAEAQLDPPNPGNENERLPDEGNPERLAEFLAGEQPTVVYYGKLIENKGVQVLLEALRGLDARAVIVGFGDYRAELEEQAAGLDVLFTGPLEHRHLVHLLALGDAAVVPSIFPEAFGMVAAEAAAAGCPPVVANHSGLAEIARGLEEDYPPGRGWLASFPNGDAAALRERLEGVLALRGDDREALRAAARRATVERWSWTSVARRI